jgi:hypothetical protein
MWYNFVKDVLFGSFNLRRASQSEAKGGIILHDCILLLR